MCCGDDDGDGRGDGMKVVDDLRSSSACGKSC